MLTIRTILEKHKEEQKNSTFLIDGETGTFFSYDDLYKKVIEIGKYLDTFNLSKGNKIAFLMDNGPFTAFLFLAIAYHGFVIVPINAVAGKSQINYILSHSDSILLFVSTFYKEKMKETISLFSSKIKIIEVDEITGFKKIDLLNSDKRNSDKRNSDKGNSDKGNSDKGNNNKGNSDKGNNNKGNKFNEIDGDTEALLIYTSGTTGKPKGVLLTHKNIIAGGQNTILAHKLKKDDRALCVLPLYHINGQIVTVITPFVSGSSVVMPRRFSPRIFWDLIIKYNCSWFSVVPTIISYLLNEAEKGGFDKKKLPKSLFGRSASAPLSRELHIKFEKTFGVTMIETMGLSETAAQILSNPREGSKIKYGSPGIPYGNRVELIDEQDNFLKDNEVGEIVIKGDNVMKCYYKNKEETSKSFIKGLWFKSGDLAKKDEDGFFYITGRKKELIIKGGENISPREIDDVLYKYPGVLEASAFGVASKDYGEEILACIYPSSYTDLNVNKLKIFCKECLDSFKVPRDILISKDPLPKGPSGKIQRLKLAERYKNYIEDKL